MKTLIIEIPDSEYCGLRQIAAKYGVTVRELLTGFVADATGSCRSGGSDERDRADEYVERRFADFVNHSTDQAEKELRFSRSERWYSAERRHAEYERQKRADRA